MDMLTIHKEIIDEYQKIFFLPYTEKDQLEGVDFILTEKERIRANSIKNIDSHKQFVFGRYLTRRVLSENYNLNVTKKDFFCNKFGKPALY